MSKITPSNNNWETYAVYPADELFEMPRGGLLDALNFLWCEDDEIEGPHWQMQAYEYRRLVIGKFIKEELNSKFKMEQLNRRWSKEVAPEVTLWQRTLEMLERLHTLGALEPLCRAGLISYPSPPFVLAALIKEKAFLMCNFSLTESTIDGITGKETAIARWQKQNRQIQYMENPFDPDEHPYTSLVLAIAQKTCNLCDQFKRKYFTPTIRARMTRIARLKDGKGKLSYKGKKIRQGMSVVEQRQKEISN